MTTGTCPKHEKKPLPNFEAFSRDVIKWWKVNGSMDEDVILELLIQNNLIVGTEWNFEEPKGDN